MIEIVAEMDVDRFELPRSSAALSAASRQMGFFPQSY